MLIWARRSSNIEKSVPLSSMRPNVDTREATLTNSYFRHLAWIVTIFSHIPFVFSFDDYQLNDWTLRPAVELRFGLQYGEGINFGYGAIDDKDEKNRSSASISLEPELPFTKSLFSGEMYGKLSFVGATNFLDGEISGQFATSGDSRVDIDEAHVGWRNSRFDISVGAQVLVFGDGLVIGDGNFDIGSEQGQFWLGAFDAWKNSAVVSVHTDDVDIDAFWLRSDGGFGDSRLFGINLDNKESMFGRYGAMYLNIYQGDTASYDGIQAVNLRALDVPLPGLEALKFYGEVVLQLGRDKDNRNIKNKALGWYLEADYSANWLKWPTVFAYRYSRFSGDEIDTFRNESYRSLFYGFYAREWDTFYQGEIAGEYHLFNSNQETQFFKVRTFPAQQFAITFYYFEHDLDEPHYFGTRTSTVDWADEINIGVEYFAGDKVYIYTGFAWSTPNQAAREVFQGDNFSVLQTWMSFKF